MPQPRVSRERKGRLVDDDLRPSVLALAPRWSLGAGSVRRTGRCRWTPSWPPDRGASGPVELLEGLGADVALVRARRTKQWIERDGARWEPLPVAGEPRVLS